MALPSFERLIAALERLPGIGPKSARRLALHLLSAADGEADAFLDALSTARARTRCCSLCHALTEEDPCSLCADPTRDLRLVAVVEDPADVDVLEKTREFKGRYHVLGGAPAPLRRVGPDELHVAALLARVAPERTHEALPA